MCEIVVDIQFNILIVRRLLHYQMEMLYQGENMLFIYLFLFIFYW